MKRNIGLTITAGLGPVMFGVAVYYLAVSVWLPNINKQSAPTFDVQAVQATADPNRHEDPLITGYPTRIEAPSIGLNLPVADGFFYSNDQSWTLSDDKAHFATMTAQPNNQDGLTFIYGHNLPSVFKSLGNLKLGETVTLHTDNGHRFTYRYSYLNVTEPTDVSLFSYRGAPILVLQTCSGLWYQDRALQYFTLEEVI